MFHFKTFVSCQFFKLNLVVLMSLVSACNTSLKTENPGHIACDFKTDVIEQFLENYESEVNSAVVSVEEKKIFVKRNHENITVQYGGCFALWGMVEIKGFQYESERDIFERVAEVIEEFHGNITSFERFKRTLIDSNVKKDGGVYSIEFIGESLEFYREKEDTLRIVFSYK